jgi:Pentapeptide repeats (8 copies)
MFERNPSIQTWKAVHGHMRLGALDERSQVAIVRGLSARDVPERLDDAAAVDMATYAWSGSVETIRQQNVRAQRIGSLSMALRTARMAWLMMALRAGYLTDRVDLSSMDLRDRSRFVGQSMNLRAVDFSGSRLSGATWHGCDLTWSTFTRMKVDGRLTCVDCIWYPGGKPQGKTFVHGRWIP